MAYPKGKTVSQFADEAGGGGKLYLHSVYLKKVDPEGSPVDDIDEIRFNYYTTRQAPFATFSDLLSALPNDFIILATGYVHQQTTGSYHSFLVTKVTRHNSELSVLYTDSDGFAFNYDSGGVGWSTVNEIVDKVAEV